MKRLSNFIQTADVSGNAKGKMTFPLRNLLCLSKVEIQKTEYDMQKPKKIYISPTRTFGKPVIVSAVSSGSCEVVFFYSININNSGIKKNKRLSEFVFHSLLM